MRNSASLHKRLHQQLRWKPQVLLDTRYNPYICLLSRNIGFSSQKVQQTQRGKKQYTKSKILFFNSKVDMNYISTKLHSHLEETQRNKDEEKLPCVHTYTNTHTENFTNVIITV